MATTNYNRLAAQVLGAVLVLVGLIGFAMDPVLGIFHVSLLHNIVHLLSGIVLLGAAFMMDGRNARLANMVLGAVYLLVAALGFLAMGTLDSLLGGTAADPALDMMDNGLHVLLGVVLLGVAFAFKGDAMMGSANRM